MDAAGVRYSTTHEWYKVEDGILIIGVTPRAIASIGDIVYVDLPGAGDDVLKEIPFGEIEGTEGSKELTSPMDGAVTEVNIKLARNPDLLSKKPLVDSWLIRLKPDAPVTLDGMLSESAYEAAMKKKKSH